MKHLFLSIVISVFLVSSIFSQSTSVPPETPETTSTSTTKKRSFSFNFDTDDSEGNSSVSIKRNEGVYRFKARFHESKTGGIKKILVDELGNSNLIVSGDEFKWLKTENGEKLYECKLTENNLKIFVDKEFASTKMIDLMDEIGVTIKDAISGSDSEEDAKKEAERELKRAEKQLMHAKRDLERFKTKLKKE